jgi:hypothetical protein
VLTYGEGEVAGEQIADNVVIGGYEVIIWGSNHTRVY